MSVLVAPNAFKGSLSASQAALAMAKGVQRGGGAPVVRPLADGGDGTLDVLRQPLGLSYRRARALDPLGRRIFASWGYNPKTRTAVVEMARASGLALLKARERDPLRAASYGTGQLIRAAIRAGARVVLVGLGGSATVDGGLGVLQALGARVFLRSFGKIVCLDRPATGKDLIALHAVDTAIVDRLLKGVRLRILCDVDNPLLGARGAARAFGPQKGASPADIRKLERGLRALAKVIRSKGGDVSQAGMGAAGGAAAGLVGLVHAKQEKGVETIFRLIGLERRVKQADLVLTGEGRVDRTSWEGKSLGELVLLCRRHKRPIAVVAGAVGPGGRRKGTRVVSIGNEQMVPEEKMRRAKNLLEDATARILRSMGEKK